MAISFLKQPDEVLDYDVDMEEWFTENGDDDDIEEVTYKVESMTEEEPALVVGPPTHDAIALIGEKPTRFKVWLGGGTNNTDYKLTFLATTERGRVKEIEMVIKVRDK